MEMNEDLVMMRDGRMMVERNGELMEMEEDMTMLDGTACHDGWHNHDDRWHNSSHDGRRSHDHGWQAG